MRLRPKVLFTALAVAVLAAALLAPIAGASGWRGNGMMGGGSGMMPTPTPSPSSTTAPGGWGDSWCGGGV